jgi:hypothetical protein
MVDRRLRKPAADYHGRGRFPDLRVFTHQISLLEVSGVQMSAKTSAGLQPGALYFVS